MTSTPQSRHPKGPLVDAEPARRHVRNLMAARVSLARIAKAAEVGIATVSGLLYTRGPGRGRCEQLREENSRRILSVRAADVVTGTVDAAGTRRRLQALMAGGWPQLRLGPHFGLHPHYVTELLRQPRVYGTTAVVVAAAYDRLWNQDPRQHGVALGAYKKVRTHARANAFAPAGAWDDETIDDPTAAPEWTGYCGTDRGYWVHKRQNIPGCARCEAAHQAWEAEHAHLSSRERGGLLFKARAAAVTREADLAADAREILRFNTDFALAAERLGVTTDHLDRALHRHPEAVSA
ncbi:hypothetical protein ACWC3Y_11145 [Streptomyces sp. NPDC001296]